MEDHCDACGFDGRSLTLNEVAMRIDELPARLGQVIRDRSEVEMRRRSNGRGWSTVEYLGHLRDLMGFHRWVIERATTEEVPTIGSADPDAAVKAAGYASAEPKELLAQLERRTGRLAQLIRGLTPEGERRRVVLPAPQGPVEVAFVARSALHESVHHHGDIERFLRK